MQLMFEIYNYAEEWANTTLLYKYVISTTFSGLSRYVGGGHSNHSDNLKP